MIGRCSASGSAGISGLTLLVYLLVNSFIVVIWAVTGHPGFFWPVFPIAGWGIGVVMNAWDVFWRSEITEENIQHEMDRENRRD